MPSEKYKLAVVYANERLIGSINEISKALKSIDKVSQVKVYSTEKFIEKTKKKFHKVVVLTDKPNPKFDIYRGSMDPENGTEMLIVSESNAENTLPMVQGLNHIVTTSEIDIISNWWPTVLRFLFRSKALEDEAKQNACLMLLNDDEVLDDNWANKICNAVQIFGLKCVRPGQPDYVAIKEGRGERLRYQVILATETGEAMLRKQQQDFGVNVGSYDKIICFTKDKWSNVCKTIKNFKDVNVSIIEVPLHTIEFGYKDWVVLLNNFNLIELTSSEYGKAAAACLIVFTVILVILVLPVVIFLYITCVILTGSYITPKVGNAVSHSDD